MSGDVVMVSRKVPGAFVILCRILQVVMMIERRYWLPFIYISNIDGLEHLKQ